MRKDGKKDGNCSVAGNLNVRLDKMKLQILFVFL